MQEIRILGGRQLLVGVAASLLGGMPGGVVAGPPPPVEAFGALPAVSSVAISPDGSLLAWHDQTGPEGRVAIYDLTTAKYRRLLRVDPQAKIRELEWSDDETVLVTVGFTRDLGVAVANWNGHDLRLFEIWRTIAADARETPGRMLLMSDNTLAGTSGAHIVAVDTSKPKAVLMATLDPSRAVSRPTVGPYLPKSTDRSTHAYSLFEVDTRTGKGVLRESGTAATAGWISDPSGQHVARIERDPARHLFAVQVLLDSAWHEILRGDDHHSLAVLGFSTDYSSLLALGRIGASKAKLWSLPLDGSSPRVLLEDPEQDVTAVHLDRYAGQPVWAHLNGLDPKVVWLSNDIEMRQKALGRALPGRAITIVDRSRNGERVLVEAESASTAPVYYLVDFQTHKADIVGEPYPGLADVALGHATVTSYKARDGTEIPAILTLPPGLEPKNLPLVVLPHGGPQARDVFGFDWWSQFLATRGYAVLQPQFRGSTGFGDAFEKAGYRQWGRLMQDDVSDGVAAMIDRGIVDAKRVCIVGASYGGYAALAGAAFTPTLYKCAASINGVSNLPEMLAHLKRAHGSSVLDFWREHIGDADDPNVISKSPMHAAARITIPILLVHASDDTVVPFAQSEGMASALAKAGRPTSVVALPGEDHWLSKAETRTRVLKELERFLAANL